MKKNIVLYACVNIAAAVLFFAASILNNILPPFSPIVVIIAVYVTWLVVLLTKDRIRKYGTLKSYLQGVLALIIIPSIFLASSGLFIWSIVFYLGGPDGNIGVLGCIAIGSASLILSIGCYAAGWLLYFVHRNSFPGTN
jgi:hypothetical protein